MSDNINIINIFFIILYNFILFIGFFLEIKYKFIQEKRIKEKVQEKITTDIKLDIDKDEKLMLKILAKASGFDKIEDFIYYTLNEDLNNENG